MKRNEIRKRIYWTKTATAVVSSMDPTGGQQAAGGHHLDESTISDISGVLDSGGEGDSNPVGALVQQRAVTAFEKGAYALAVSNLVGSKPTEPTQSGVYRVLESYLKHHQSTWSDIQSNVLNQEYGCELIVRADMLWTNHGKFVKNYEKSIMRSDITEPESRVLNQMYADFQSLHRRCIGAINNRSAERLKAQQEQEKSFTSGGEATQENLVNNGHQSDGRDNPISRGISSSLEHHEDREEQLDVLDHPTAEMAAAPRGDSALETIPAERTQQQFVPYPSRPTGTWKGPRYHIAELSFDGDPREWPTFKNTFLNLYANTPTERFHYLLTMLKGTAKDVLYGFIVNNQRDFDLVWETLCKRFENKPQLVKSQLDRFFEVSPMRENSATSLRKVVDTTRGMCRALQLLEVDPSQLGDVFINYHLMNLLDEESRIFWNQERKGTLMSTEKLIEFLESRARAFEDRPQSNPGQNFQKRRSGAGRPN